LFRVGLATTARTYKDGGKAKATPETLKDRGLEAHMKGQRHYVLVLKELHKRCPRQSKIIFKTSNYEFL